MRYFWETQNIYYAPGKKNLKRRKTVFKSFQKKSSIPKKKGKPSLFFFISRSRVKNFFGSGDMKRKIETVSFETNLFFNLHLLSRLYTLFFLLQGLKIIKRINIRQNEVNLSRSKTKIETPEKKNNGLGYWSLLIAL